MLYPRFRFSIYENTHSMITFASAHLPEHTVHSGLKVAEAFIKDELGICGILIYHTLYILSTEENLKKIKEARTMFALQDNVYLFKVSSKWYRMDMRTQ
jgi:hypothetical protein